MCRVCPHVHLSHISGHFQSNTVFQGIFTRYSGKFPVRCIISRHLSAFSYNMENTYGGYLENTYRGFFQNNVWGELCLPM